MLIDCDTCAARPSGCDGCVMTLLIRDEQPGLSASSADPLDPGEQAAVAALAEAGLVAPLRMAPLQRAVGQ